MGDSYYFRVALHKYIYAVGSAGLVTSGMLGLSDVDGQPENKVVIDVGVNLDDDGKLCGDVDFDAVEPLVDAITPVPGGVGSVVTSLLLLHLAIAAKSRRG